jgi:5-methylcytosine-specific restriction endonuclease McrA
MTVPEFRPGLPAAQVDRSLRRAVTVLDAARRCALLWFHDALARRLYHDLGYASMQQYAAVALGFSRNRTCQFLRLARDLDRLPPLKDAVVAGRLEWTKAQQVARIATPETAPDWVDVAVRSSRRELSRGIKAARLAARRGQPTEQPALPLGARAPVPPPPVRVTLSLSFDNLDAARLTAMIEAAKKSRRIPAAASREETILAALAAWVTDDKATVRRRNGGTAASYRVVIYRCRECGAAEVVTNSGRRAVDAASTEAALENAVIHDEGTNRHAIPPGLRQKVFARDGYRCQAPGCDRTLFLEVHHKVPRERGGTNQIDNLTTLCSRCHRYVHGHRHPAANVPTQVDGGRETCAGATQATAVSSGVP